jgi:hypothetical protein
VELKAVQNGERLAGCGFLAGLTKNGGILIKKICGVLAGVVYLVMFVTITNHRKI